MPDDLAAQIQEAVNAALRNAGIEVPEPEPEPEPEPQRPALTSMERRTVTDEVLRVVRRAAEGDSRVTHVRSNGDSDNVLVLTVQYAGRESDFVVECWEASEHPEVAEREPANA